MKNTHITTRAEREAMTINELIALADSLEELAHNAFRMRDTRFGFLNRQLEYVWMELDSREVRA